MRYVKVNRGFLELTGFKRDALIGRSMHDFNVLAGAEKHDLAVERLLLGGAHAVHLCRPAPRWQAEEVLKHSEERFSKAFRMAPGPMAILALDGFCIADVGDGERERQGVGSCAGGILFAKALTQRAHANYAGVLGCELAAKLGITRTLSTITYLRSTIG